MRILAITPWDGQGTPSGQACGIANYAQLLQAHLPPAAEVELVPDPEALDPHRFLTNARVFPDVLWLNYHRGLHSRWTPETLRDIRTANPTIPVAITFHDTYGESAPDALTLALHDLADAFVVHEPCVGLDRAVVIRQGVPGWQLPYAYERSLGSWCGQRPILGTVGFNFPWKGFDQLAEVTAAAGWGYLVLSNNATPADEARWLAANPQTRVLTGVQSTSLLVSRLAGCDATAFPYQCANSGTSGAIRLGLAARKPVLASASCRQNRDLFENPLGRASIRWLYDLSVSGIAKELHACPMQRVDPGIVACAAQDSWARQGERYAAVFRQVATAAGPL